MGTGQISLTKLTFGHSATTVDSCRPLSRAINGKYHWGADCPVVSGTGQKPPLSLVSQPFGFDLTSLLPSPVVEAVGEHPKNDLFLLDRGTVPHVIMLHGNVRDNYSECLAFALSRQHSLIGGKIA